MHPGDIVAASDPAGQAGPCSSEWSKWGRRACSCSGTTPSTAPTAGSTGPSP